MSSRGRSSLNPELIYDDGAFDEEFDPELARREASRAYLAALFDGLKDAGEPPCHYAPGSDVDPELGRCPAWRHCAEHLMACDAFKFYLNSRTIKPPRDQPARDHYHRMLYGPFIERRPNKALFNILFAEEDSLLSDEHRANQRGARRRRRRSNNDD